MGQNGVFHGFYDGSNGREVKDVVNIWVQVLNILQESPVSDIPLDEFKVILGMGKVLFLSGREVVNNKDLPTFFKAGLNKVGPNEARTTCD